MSSDKKINISKWVCAVIITVLSLFGIFLSLWLASRKHVGRLESFSGGIIFASGYVHLLEESTKRIFKNSDIQFPVPGATAVSIFSALTIVLVFTSTVSDEEQENEKEELTASQNNSNLNRKSSYSQNLQHDVNTIDGTDSTGSEENEKVSINSKDKKKSKKIQFLPITNFIIYLIFCLNTFIEGIEMGNIETNSELIKLSVLISTRKIFESFLIGSLLNNNRINKIVYFILTIIYSLLFLLSFILEYFLHIKIDQVVVGVLQALGSGTFIYLGVTKWVVFFLNRKTWSYLDKFWHLGLFSIATLCIILISIVSK